MPEAASREKSLILRQLIDRVNIGRDFEIEVEFKISVTQFFDFLHPEGDNVCVLSRILKA